jgi:hypothetical protein
MAGFFGPKVDVVSRSGMLCVTVHPTPNWQAGLLAVGGDILLAVLLYQDWPITTFFMRAVWILLMISAVLGWVYQLLGEEVIEVDSRKLTIYKGIHGWERTRVYQISECSDLEWHAGHRGGSFMGCKVGSWPRTFAKNISEADADKVLSALQQTLPDVAQQICAKPGHFIALGLSRQ